METIYDLKSLLNSRLNIYCNYIGECISLNTCFLFINLVYQNKTIFPCVLHTSKISFVGRVEEILRQSKKLLEECAADID